MSLPIAGPFTTAEGVAAGLGRGKLRGPRVRRIFPGVHVDAAAPVTMPVLVGAAQKLLPDDALPTGSTALRLAGAPVGTVLPLRFVTTHPHHVRRPGLQVSRVRLLPAAVAGSVPPTHAFVTCATELDLVELVTAGDRLVRLGLVRPADLARHAAACSGRGVRTARRAAALVRDRVDSPQETELRLCLVLAGLPEPECNPLVGVDEPIGRVDLRYRAYRIALEYEGDQHRTDPHQWNRDIERHERLLAAGETVVRITAQRMARPRAVVSLVLQSLRAAGYGGPDPVLTPEWLAVFSPSARRSRLAHAFEVPGRALGG